jgi:Pyridine nucleotide-disulphide oxidoreductase
MSTTLSPPVTPHQVVVVGGGFGGLETVKALRGAPVDVTLIDRNNYHLFQPLTYQVATGALSPNEIAEPLRTIFRRDAHVHVVMGEVTDVNLDRRVVRVEPRTGDFEPVELGYDTLVVGGGSRRSARWLGRRCQSDSGETAEPSVYADCLDESHQPLARSPLLERASRFLRPIGRSLSLSGRGSARERRSRSVPR